MSKYREAEKAFRALGLNTRTINALVARGVFNMTDLRRLTAFDLRVIPGIGPKGISQLEVYVRSPGPSQEIHTRPRVVSVSFEPGALTAIDSFAIAEGIANRAAAVRRLVELGLKVKR